MSAVSTPAAASFSLGAVRERTPFARSDEGLRESDENPRDGYKLSHGPTFVPPRPRDTARLPALFVRALRMPMGTNTPGVLSRTRATLAEAARDAVNLSLNIARTVLFPAGVPSDPARVVVHRVGNIGDIVATIPALIALRTRFPHSRLTLVSSTGGRGLPGAADVLGCAPFLDDLVTYAVDNRTSAEALDLLLARFRQLRPNLLVMLPPANAPPRVLYRNLAFARLAGADYVVGLQTDVIRSWLTDQARKQRLFRNEPTRLLDLLNPLGVREAPLQYAFPPLSQEERARVDAIAPERPFVAVCPGGKKRDQLWPREHFAEVARRIRREFGHEIVLIGSEEERENCDWIARQVGGARSATGQLSVIGTTELLRRTDALLTNDTGPMHLAAAVGSRVVAIFSSNELPGRWYPVGPGHVVIRARDVCDVCLGDPIPKPHCTATIDVERVWQACAAVLAVTAENHSTTASNGS